MNTRLGKTLYGAAFCLLVPAILVLWAARLDVKPLALPRLQSVPAGTAIAIAGLALLVRAVWDLWHAGGGLPMNAFPPPKFVATGAFRIVPHPIYTGFGLVVPGVAIALGSAAGLWIVSPVVWLAMVSLVVGHERIDLRSRFGDATTNSLLATPPASLEPLDVRSRVATAVLAFVPWLIGYQACALLGPSGHAIDTMEPFERSIPVWEWTGVFYLGAYIWTMGAPFAARSRSALRNFSGAASWGTGLILWLFLALPLVVVPRGVDSATWMGNLLRLDRSLDTVACAFPSFHVFWAFTAAGLWAERIGRRASIAVAVLIAASCITTGAHSVIDVVAGWLVHALVARRAAVWELIRTATERLANSWRDWRIGPVRIINHGGYVAAAATSGLWIVGLLLGHEFRMSILTVALFSIAGAGIWGQWLEASSVLSRPFGYFGGLFGGCVGVIVVHVLTGQGWEIAAAFAVAAPVIQAIGRVRCLVQGCCHGRPADERLGIRYTQPLSRVCKIARLDGVPVHATPLYSILGNVVILGLLVRLWIEGANAALIAGAYLILSTCARFMEEGYRGEPQTVRPGGLPIYQWLATGCLLAGIALSLFPAPDSPSWSGWSLAPLIYSVPVGLLVWLAMGVDFPDSRRRMSRLA